MNSDLLKVFIATARHRSVTRAADELHLTQSAVSKQLKVLEHALGAKLYERNGHGIVLTLAGQTLLDKGTPILASLQQLQASIPPPKR